MIDTQQLAETLKPRFGEDLSLALARAPAWGHADACLLVYGQRHEDAAIALIVGLASTGATKFKTDVLTSGGFRGMPAHTYSTISFNP